MLEVTVKNNSSINMIQLIFKNLACYVKLTSNIHLSSNITVLSLLNILKACYTFFRYEKRVTTVRAILQREYTNDNVITSNFR